MSHQSPNKIQSKPDPKTQSFLGQQNQNYNEINKPTKYRKQSKNIKRNPFASKNQQQEQRSYSLFLNSCLLQNIFLLNKKINSLSSRTTRTVVIFFYCTYCIQEKKKLFLIIPLRRYKCSREARKKRKNEERTVLF